MEKALKKSLPADLVVLNPPRAGVDEEVTQLLNVASHKPKAVIYVSCNPATLARDIRRLPAYSIRSLRGFDMFPGTHHVEALAWLRRVAPGPSPSAPPQHAPSSRPMS